MKNEQNNILEEFNITELEDRLEFGICGGGDGSGGGNGGDGCPSEDTSCDRENDEQ